MTESKKPSEQIAAGLDEARATLLAKARAHAGDVTDDEWERYIRQGADGQQIELGALAESTIRYLNTEHERRAKFEQDITERVWALEGKS